MTRSRYHRIILTGHCVTGGRYNSALLSADGHLLLRLGNRSHRFTITLQPPRTGRGQLSVLRCPRCNDRLYFNRVCPPEAWVCAEPIHTLHMLWDTTCSPDRRGPVIVERPV